MQPYWFDLDGTLIDTRAALIAAYSFVGVVAPEAKIHLPWKQWCTQLEHDRKNASYEYFLRKHAEPMPLLKYAVDNQSVILTGASWEAVRKVERAFNVLLNVSLVSGSVTDKIACLNVASLNGISGTYVDDNEEHRRAIANATQWRLICPKQAEKELCCDVRS